MSDKTRNKCSKEGVTNSRGFMGRVGSMGPEGLLRGLLSLKFKNPQTHILSCVHGFLGLWVSLIW